ncbi:CHASE2 domain-containing protein [Desulfococcus sp.]|uniref:CHASE2 domain-containing protein n=1 Tax=Desulfococcus sp. TaxID=2025834 RepID=UPI0035945331
MKTRLGKYEASLLLLLFCLSIASEYFEAFSLLEYQTISIRHALRSSHGDRQEMSFPLDKIALVTIDEYFFREYGKSPLRRADLASILRNLGILGARVICVDLLLDLPDAYGEDLILASALQQSRGILASRLLFDRRNRFLDISYPTPRLREAAKSGYVNIPSTSALVSVLERIRIHPETIHLKNGWPMAVQAAAAYLGVTPRLRDGRLILGGLAIPLNQFNDIKIDFSTIPSGYHFIHELAGISAYEFLDISFLTEESLRELRDWVAGKIVIIGETSSFSSDWFNTPVGVIYGAEIIADSINTLLKGAPLRHAPLWAEVTTSLVVLLLVVWLGTGIRTMGLQLVSAVVLPAGFLCCSAVLYVRYGIIIGVTHNLVMGFLVYFLINLSLSFKEKALRIALQGRKEQAEREKSSAEAASRQKSEFLANMSHEIRTPMNAILGFAEILESRMKDPQQRQYLSIIRSSGRSLLMLINDILDLSKIEAGKVELTMRPVNIRTVFRDMGMMFRKKLDEKGIGFQMDIDPGLPDLLCMDEGRFRQILLNLIGNAVKFTDSGYVRLTVAAVREDESGRSWSLAVSVEDTGIGIPESQTGRIFEAFEQQEGQSHARYGGTGLGLAISRRLAEMMGGRITVRSTMGAGSVFEAVFPELTAAPAPAASEPQPEAATEDASLFEPATILVAEDVQVNRDLIKAFLRDGAFDVIEAENGEDAVALARAFRPDLVLMDMRMPGMDGFEAVRRIRADAGIADTPVIAVSASTMNEEVDRIREVCNAFLSKPVQGSELMRTMARFLPCRTAPAALPPSAAPRTGDLPADPAGRVFPAPPADGRRIEKWKELFQILDRCLSEGSCRAGGVIVFDRIEAMGLEMRELGRTYEYPRLCEWADQLLDQARSIDVMNLPMTLERFSQLVEGLRVHADA